MNFKFISQIGLHLVLLTTLFLSSCGTVKVSYKRTNFSANRTVQTRAQNIVEQTISEDLYGRIQQERRRCHVPVLSRCAYLEKLAMERTLERARKFSANNESQIKKALSHDGFGALAAKARTDKGYRLGENNAWQYSTSVGSAISGIHKVLCSSLGHHRNMTRPYWKNVGVATVKVGNDTYVTQLFSCDEREVDWFNKTTYGSSTQEATKAMKTFLPYKNHIKVLGL